MTNHEPIRVMLADDDEGFLVSLRELIDRQPELSVVGTALDGVQAVELAGSTEPDAAVIDLHMPRLDGAATIARLRQQQPGICLIALTGDPDPELHATVLRAGADAVLGKGELVTVLLERLARVDPRSSRAAGTG
jgi:DNA-binding NarL/FixJ family response regulator